VENGRVRLPDVYLPGRQGKGKYPLQLQIGYRFIQRFMPVGDQSHCIAGRFQAGQRLPGPVVQLRRRRVIGKLLGDGLRMFFIGLGRAHRFQQAPRVAYPQRHLVPQRQVFHQVGTLRPVPMIPARAGLGLL